MMSNTGRRRRGTSSIAPSPTSSSRSGSRCPGPAQLPQWKFSQVLGELPPAAAGDQHKGVLQDDDGELSALEFDGRGEHLAAGDHAGRVIIFRRTDEDDTRRRAELERTDHAGAPPPRYSYATEFQSHELEFDTLHSLEICEKIKKLRWCARPNSSLFMLATNDRTVKLWKVSKHKPRKGSDHQPRRGFSALSANPVHRSEKGGDAGDEYSAKCRRVFGRAHQYNINSISNNCDGETFVSADDLRINLWHLEVTGQCFNIVDTKPAHMEDLVGDHRGRVPPVLLQHAGVRQLERHRPAARPAAVGAVRSKREDIPGSRGPLSTEDVFHRDSLLHHGPTIHRGREAPSDTRLHEPEALGLAQGKLPRRHVRGSRVPSSKAAGAVHRRPHLRPVQLLRQQRRELLRYWILQVCTNMLPKRIELINILVLLASNTFKVFSRDAANTSGTTLEASKNPYSRAASTQTYRPSKGPGLLNNFARRNNRKGQDGLRSAGNKEEISCNIASKVTQIAWHPTENFIVCAANNSLYMYHM